MSEQIKLKDIKSEVNTYGICRKIYLPDLINALTKDYSISERAANGAVNHFLNLEQLELNNDRMIGIVEY